jgi:hypothetical protein
VEAGGFLTRTLPDTEDAERVGMFVMSIEHVNFLNVQSLSSSLRMCILWHQQNILILTDYLADYFAEPTTKGKRKSLALDLDNEENDIYVPETK